MSRKMLKQGRMSAAKAKAEAVIDMKEAAGMFISKPTTQCLWNWRTRGIMREGVRIKLEWFKEGGGVYTTKEAVERFKLATNGE